jgi:hypothetical protein
MNEHQMLSSGSTEDNDEISLVDLFAVMIRRRRFIVLGTAICTVLAVLYIFLLPQLTGRSDRRYTATFSAAQVQFPKGIEAKIGVSVGNLAAGRAMQQDFAAAEYRRYPLMGEKNIVKMLPFEYNSYIATQVLQGKYSVTFNGQSLVMTFITSDVRQAQALASSVVTDLNRYLEETITPAVEQAAAAAQAIIDTGKTHEGKSAVIDTGAYTQQQQLLEDIKVFRKLNSTFFVIKKTPFITTQPQGKTKKMVIAVFVFFFIFVFIAFLLNALENIKKDPEVIKKLSDAWKAGK